MSRDEQLARWQSHDVFFYTEVCHDFPIDSIERKTVGHCLSQKQFFFSTMKEETYGNICREEG